MPSPHEAYSSQAGRSRDVRAQDGGPSSSAVDRVERKPYRPPALTAWGDLRDVTLSPSPGNFESGSGVGFRS